MIRTALKKYGILFAVCIFSSLFFSMLYRFNNKYSQRTVQAEHGVLTLSEQEIQKAPLRFLVSGWHFYPGELLTPAQIRESDRPAAELSIGAQTDFSSSFHPSPYGCGTYQMTFVLPDLKEGYALELPEIFSAYSLYVNDRLVLEMGSTAQHPTQIQKRLVTFSGKEPVTLTIAVSNYTHFYSGIIHPPAFGIPLAVNTARGLRFAICLIICTITLICALLSFYLGLRMKQKNALLFSLICLTMCIFSASPALYMIIALPVFPWYALELCCIYLIVWQLIIMQNRICRPGFFLTTASNAVGCLFFFRTLGYGLSSSHLTPSAIHRFSASVLYYKAFAALYLLFAAILALHKTKNLRKSIVYSTIIATVAFLWDRLLPVYEPIIGGYFIEWGYFAVAAAIGCSLWCDVVEGYSNSLIFQEERKQVSRQLSMQTEYSQRISEANTENRRLIHDIKHQLRATYCLAAEHGQSEICDFLLQVEEQVTAVPGHTHTIFCENPAVNALIEYYCGTAQAQNTEFQVRLDLPEKMPFTNVELCTVLGNLLDNAVEACSRQKTEPRRILIAGETIGNTFFLKVENTCDEPARLDGSSRFLSWKRHYSSHGIGISSVRKIVETYKGHLDIVSRQHSFFVGVSVELLELSQQA